MYLAALDRPVDPTMRSELNFTLRGLITRIESIQQRLRRLGRRPRPTRLADALVTRSLMIAARRGIPVDPNVIKRATARPA